jgi:hypothetical protein
MAVKETDGFKGISEDENRIIFFGVKLQTLILLICALGICICVLVVSISQ